MPWIDILIAAAAVLTVALVVVFQVRAHRRAKKAGVPNCSCCAGGCPPGSGCADKKA